MLGIVSCSCCRLPTLKKNLFRNTIRVSNSLDPDQDGHYVGPELGPNCLKRLSADEKSYCHGVPTGLKST